MVLPIRQVRSVQEFIERFPQVKEVIIDGTERPIQRPVEQERQKLNYSGKKNRHLLRKMSIFDRN